jgi:hypothetical protein
MVEIDGHCGLRDQEGRRITELAAELEQLHEMLDARIADAHAACAGGDRATAAAAVRWILALTTRMRTLTREWRALDTSALHAEDGAA